MSISTTVDVFCDKPGCLDWVHGTCSGKFPEIQEARRVAKKQRWGRLLVLGNMMDLCPRHAEEWEKSKP